VARKRFELCSASASASAYFLLDLIKKSIPCSAQELAEIAAFWDA
jgi:hypothetical protein